MALHNLERFVRGGEIPSSIGTLFERDPQALPTLLQIFSTSQYLSDLLVIDPEGFDLLRLTEGEPVARQRWSTNYVAEIAALEHETAVLRALRRFKRRETLRIAYGDIVREQSLRTVDHADFLRGRGHSGGRVAGGVAKVPAHCAAPRCGPTGDRRASSCWAWASSAAWN